MFLSAVVVVALACGQAAQAQDFEYVGVDVPLQRVEFESGGTGGFGAKALIRSDGRARGRLKIGLPDGTRLAYDVYGGAWTQDPDTGEIGVVLDLVRSGTGTLGRDDFAVARSTPDPGVEGCDIWDFQGSDVHDVKFAAMGKIEFVSGPEDEDAESDFVGVDVPLQRVEFESGGTGGFGVEALIGSDGRARGRLKIALPDGTRLAYDVFGGAWTQDPNSGEMDVELQLVRSGTGTPGRDDFAVARSTPDPGVEGCDIWDFSGNGVHVRFPAMGDIELVGR